MQYILRCHTSMMPCHKCSLFKMVSWKLSVVSKWLIKTFIKMRYMLEVADIMSFHIVNMAIFFTFKNGFSYARIIMQMQFLKFSEDIWWSKLDKIWFLFLNLLIHSKTLDKDEICKLLENCFASVKDKVTKRFENF